MVEADNFIPGLCEGEPGQQEMEWWRDHDTEYSKFATRHFCYHCGSRNTRWIRQEWCVCFFCMQPFNLTLSFEYEDEVLAEQEAMRVQEENIAADRKAFMMEEF